MIEPLIVIKLVHILSAILLFGTGLGTAFHMWMAHLSGDVRAIAIVARNVVLADWLFTTIAGIVQPITGLALIIQRGWGLFESWLIVSYALFALAAACWIPVVVLQIRIRDLSERAMIRDQPLPPEYHAAMRQWVRLGWPAFVSMFAIVFLMVARPALW